jgi:hypothetical protein
MNETADSLVEDSDCPCCGIFFSEWAVQQLRLHWDKPNLLARDLRELVDEGYARFAWAMLDRLIELEGMSERVRRLSAQVVESTKSGKPKVE